jgi:hypothetical protein
VRLYPRPVDSDVVVFAVVMGVGVDFFDVAFGDVFIFEVDANNEFVRVCC